MKRPAFFRLALCAGSLLIASCNSDQTADSTTAATETAPADMNGMDHAAMNHDGHAAAGSDSPLMTSMNEMMQKMEAVQMKGNADHDFARHMLEHHKGAVVMADLELRDGQDAAMRQMAEKIKADQQKEIAGLEAAATRLAAAPTNYDPQNPADPFTSKMKASMDVMMKNMPPVEADPDVNFNRLMTVHHQSAVDMAQAELDHGKDAQLREMARQMIEAQQREIQQFDAWYKAKAAK